MFISWEYILFALIILPLIIAWGQTANTPRSVRMTHREYRKICKALRTKNEKLLDKTVTQIMENHFLWTLDKDKLKYYFQDIWEKCSNPEKSNFCIYLPKPKDVESYSFFHSKTSSTKAP